MAVRIGKYSRSTIADRFHIAGLAYHEAALVLSELKIGDELDMVLEPDNPYDSNAVALYFKDVMLGYIPRDRNQTIAQLTYFGHTDVFDARVVNIKLDAPSYEQVEVGIYIRDKREA